MKTKKIKHKIRSIIIQYSAVLLISFFLGEIGLRVYDYFIPIFIFYTPSYNRYRGKPFANDYYFKLNPMGFKDEEFTERDENIYRVIGIGDSFTYGVVPYKYNYLTLLESQLQKENINIEVFNMGIMSTGPIDYLSLFFREGLALEPDMVLLSFFIGNDLLPPTKRNAISYSYVASLFYYIYTILQKYPGHIFHEISIYCDNCSTFNHKTYLEIEKRRSFIYLKKNKSKITHLADNALVYLNKIQEICRINNIKFVVILIPDELQISHDLESEVRNSFYPNIEDNDWISTLPNKILAGKLKNLGIHYIDLYEYFKNKSRQQRLYKSLDTHWNIFGNQLAANIIQNYIRKYIKSAK
jgi:lysophospholipase L1-like esterase